MNTLSSSLTQDTQLKQKLKSLFSTKNYDFFDNHSLYNLNIIGVRSTTNKNPNLFDDSIVLIYNDESGTQVQVFDVTTHPGLYYLLNPIPGTNGAGILVPGQYKNSFSFGTHTSHINGGQVDSYQCLTQSQSLPVYRDNVKDGKLYSNPDTIETGMFGVQIHRAMPNSVTTNVWNWSAACQVFSDSSQFDKFMILCRRSAVSYGNSFTYTLILQSDLYSVTA